MSLSGGCLCGAVRYETNAEPAFSGHCYCTDCQKHVGGGHATVAGVPDASLKVTGSTRSYSKPGDSGQPVERTFCPNCGTTLFTRPKAMAGMTMLRAGTLDDPSKILPGMSIYTSRAQSWDPPNPGLPGFAQMPPPRH